MIWDGFSHFPQQTQMNRNIIYIYNGHVNLFGMVSANSHNKLKTINICSQYSNTRSNLEDNQSLLPPLGVEGRTVSPPDSMASNNELPLIYIHSSLIINCFSLFLNV
jgi:hypothetical protein